MIMLPITLARKDKQINAMRTVTNPNSMYLIAHHRDPTINNTTLSQAIKRNPNSEMDLKIGESYKLYDEESFNCPIEGKKKKRTLYIWQAGAKKMHFKIYISKLITLSVSENDVHS